MKTVWLLVGLLYVSSAGADALDEALRVYDAKDYGAARRLLEPLALQGDTTARINLAYLLYAGKGGKADAAEAAKWYRLAAEAGDPYAQYSLGVLYENGKGVPRDLQEAVHWWRASAQQGYADAQYNLGAMYYNGRGVERDRVRAYVWKSLAAEAGPTTVPLRKARTGRDAIGAVLSRDQLATARELLATCSADLQRCD